MPTYVYEILNPDGSGTGRTFEHVQSMSDAALSRHPQTGAPVRRVPQAPHIAGGWSDLKTKGKLSDKNLQRLGFTKYVNQGGKLDKAFGKGPQSIKE